MEAIAYDYMEITNDYRNAGIKIDRITITEGGSKDDLWNQIKADIMQSETITLEVSGGAVLTDCIIGAYAEGDIEDLKEALVNNIKIINKYSPNANNSNVYKEQYVLRKSVLSGVDSNIK
ncbi:FGGY-family carbohydrate kinase [Clostridium ljungdahlii]|uniref:FGGY-family carbohydrate kinase n=1 Tax=Clostridium ljungdahlii TaxID=1538 RepID=UPI0038675308